MSMFIHIHSSSEFNRSAQSLGQAAKFYKRHADLITFTEVASPSRKAAVKNSGGNFGHLFGNQSYSNDCAIVYSADRFFLIAYENFKATNKRFFNPNGSLREPIYATIAVLKDKRTNKNVVVGVVHLPSSVEIDLATGKKTRRTVAWYSAFRNVKSRLNKLRRLHKAKAILYTADFNIDFKKTWVRRLIKSIAPSYRIIWSADQKGGTHGNRLIDATLIKGKASGKAELFKDDKSSDHRPFISSIRWKRP